MKKIALFLTLLVAFVAAPSSAPTARAADVSLQFFYDALAPYGDWIDAGEYGYVWQPKEHGNDWRPYTVGSWAYTDAGWTWVSEEDYGSIVYHYGRWGSLENVGWVWFPDTEWAPAWVSWRSSDQYTGWAPLPPEAQTVRETGVSGWADSYYDIGPSSYTFVETRQLGTPRLSTVVLPRRESVTYVRETRNVTNIVYRDRGYFVGGPDYEVVTRRSEQPIRRLRLEVRTDDYDYRGGRDERRLGSVRSVVEGGALRVFAPTITTREDARENRDRPVQVTRRAEAVKVEHGWRDVPQAARAQLQQASPVAPASLPKQPHFDRAAAMKPKTAAVPLTATSAPGAAPAPATAAPGAATPAAVRGPKRGEAAAVANPATGTPTEPAATTTTTEMPAKPAIPPRTAKGPVPPNVKPMPGTVAGATPAAIRTNPTGEAPVKGKPSPAADTTNPDSTPARPERAGTPGKPARPGAAGDNPAATEKPAVPERPAMTEKPARGTGKEGRTPVERPNVPAAPATERPDRGERPAAPEAVRKPVEAAPMPKAAARPEVSRPEAPARPNIEREAPARPNVERKAPPAAAAAPASAPSTAARPAAPGAAAAAKGKGAAGAEKKDKDSEEKGR